MKKTIFKPTPFALARSCVAPFLFLAAVIAVICLGLQQAEISGKSAGLRILEESLLRASVKCYAMEGRYPGSLSYLEENYGIYVDETKYAVHYEAFASNMLPDITVIELEDADIPLTEGQGY